MIKAPRQRVNLFKSHAEGLGWCKGRVKLRHAQDSVNLSLCFVFSRMVPEMVGYTLSSVRHPLIIAKSTELGKQDVNMEL